MRSRWPGLRDGVVAALDEMGIRKPTLIQSAAIPAILTSGQNVLLSATTGTGKTLAFMAPLVERLKADEEEGFIVPRPQRPRAIVLVPTRELAQQAYAVARRFACTAKLRVECVLGGTSQGKQRRALDGHVDILVSTPGRLR